MAKPQVLAMNGDDSQWLELLREEFRGLKSEILSEIQELALPDVNADSNGDHWLLEEFRGLKSEIVSEVVSEIHGLAPRDATPDGDGDHWITLNQCAAFVQRKKRSLENYRNHPKYPLPLPDIRGEGRSTKLLQVVRNETVAGGAIWAPSTGRTAVRAIPAFLESWGWR